MIVQHCEEVHAFAGTAERTGVEVELASGRARKYSCRSLPDFLKKYRLYGDGFYYVPAGQWPADTQQIDLDNVKWISSADAYKQSQPKAWRERAAQLAAEHVEA